MIRARNGFDVDVRGSGGKPGTSGCSLKHVTHSNANDNVGKPLGFGTVVFAAEKEIAPVVSLFPVKASAPQPVALAA